MLLAVIFVLPLWPAYAVVKVEGLPGLNLQRFLIVLLVILWVFTLFIGRWHAAVLLKRISIYRLQVFCLIAL